MVIYPAVFPDQDRGRESIFHESRFLGPAAAPLCPEID